MVTWLDALAKTRKSFSQVFTRIFSRSDAVDDVTLEELEEKMLGADISMRLVMELTGALDKGYKGLRISRRDMLAEMLIKALGESVPFSWNDTDRPKSVLIVGVNGSGKTTSCAKLARLVMNADLKPLLAATDTFRAAGADQLRIWADRVGCDVVAGQQGADAAAVAYDALDAAVARKTDVVLVDTAGRMHTRQPLMDELAKVKRAMNKRVPHAPDETWIVLDAALGQNAITQARQFHQAVPLTGVIVSKLDGSSKAGFLFSIRRELDLPIRFAGLGEGADDLVPFDATRFVHALIGIESVAGENHVPK